MSIQWDDFEKVDMRAFDQYSARQVTQTLADLGKAQTRALIGLRAEASCVQTHAGTEENSVHLAPGFVEELRALYGGTRREAQELEGRVVDLDGALFTAEMMAAARDEVGSSSPKGGSA